MRHRQNVSRFAGYQFAVDAHFIGLRIDGDIWALGAARHATRLTFVSQAADAQGIAQQLNLQSATAVVKGCRTVKKAPFSPCGSL